jgi:hypothetical protein
MSFLVAGLVACSSSAPRAGSQAFRGGAESAGSAGQAGAELHSDAGAGGAAQSVPSPELLELAEQCGMIDPSSLSRVCPAAVEAGDRQCDPAELQDECSHFMFGPDDVEHEGAPTAVCRLRCAALDTSPFWAGPCPRCAYACEPPGDDSIVHELDTRDCLQRPLTPCAEGPETRQTSLDLTLSGLLRFSPGAFLELRNTALQIELANGCPTRFYVPVAEHSLTLLSADLVPVLAGLRLECASELGCSRIQGPDTLATP